MTAAERWAPRVALVGGFAVWCVNALVRWWLAAPLGHDEARYALAAHDLWVGGPERFFYSGPAMTLVALPGVIAGGSELALRLLPVLLGVGFLVSAWYFARVVSGQVTAAWTVAVLACSPRMATHSSELLSDLPSTAVLLLAISVLVQELTRADGVRRRIIAVAPLCALAFYLRFGGCVPIAIIGIVFAVAGHRALLRRPWPVIGMLALFVLLLVPHIVRSMQVTGSPIGLLRMSAEIPGDGRGIGPYLRQPMMMYGVLVTPLMVIGLVAARRTRFVIAVQLVAVAHVVVLAFTTQAQPRFVYFATVLLVVIGIDATGRILGGVRRDRSVRACLVALVVVSSFWMVRLVHAVRHRDVRFAGASRVLVAAAMIKADRKHARCELLAAGKRTRLEWYSGCRAVLHPQRSDAALYQVRDGLSSVIPDGATRVGVLPGFVDVIRIK